MADVLDYKKEYKDLYLPKAVPSTITVPEMAFVAVDGKGDPNDTDGEFGRAVEILYSIQYAIKMSKKKQDVPEGYFDYVVPPLEGFWTVENRNEIKDKSKYIWMAVIRLPEFVNKKVFDRTCGEVAGKKGINTEKAKFIKIKEGLCVQCLHTGPFDDEPETLAAMEKYMAENALINDINGERYHHEIYLSDFRKVAKEKMKTVLRIPARKK